MFVDAGKMPFNNNKTYVSTCSFFFHADSADFFIISLVEFSFQKDH